MEQFIKYVLGEMRVIADAPLVFVTALLALAGGIWWAMSWRYSGIVENRDSELVLARAQRDDYRDKLGGATPDQAKARIDALETRLNRVEPRRLTTEQRNVVRTSVSSGAPGVMKIISDFTCADCGNYANEFRELFVSAGWKVDRSSYTGLSLARPMSGLALRIPDVTRLSSDAERIRTAFKAADLPLEIMLWPGVPASELALDISQRFN